MVPFAQLREPELAARTEMSDAGLNSLAESIRILGIVQPLNVKLHPEGGFEIVAGHRRYFAARIVGLPELPCVVVANEDQAEAVKLHENVEREELSATDEAIFYAELYERHGQDVDAVAEKVKRTRAHVEGRLLLLSGDAEVFKATAAGELKIGVAEQLNLITDDQQRAYYLDHARRGGCTVRQARIWREQANAHAMLVAQQGEQSPGSAVPPAGVEAPPTPTLRYAAFAQPHELSSSREPRPCAFCGHVHEEWQMYRKYVCDDCQGRYFVPLEGRNNDRVQEQEDAGGRRADRSRDGQG